MKKLTVLLFSILISFNSYGLFGLFEKTVCVETDAQDRNGLVYLPNQQEPFSGNNLCEYENGQKKFEGNYKDGKLDGKDTAWHENGQKKYERNYKDGKLDGKWTVWSEDVKKQYEANYKDGKKDGWWTYYWSDGVKKESEGNYKDGKEDGKWTVYWSDGVKKLYEGNYKDGKKDGWWTFGGLLSEPNGEAYYKDGKCISGDCDNALLGGL